MQDVASTFDNFKQKIDRIKQSGGEPLRKPAVPQSPVERIKEKISLDEQERIKSIRVRYCHFQLPLSKEIEEDEISLLKAWELFSKITALNKSDSSKDTYIEKFTIASPITKKSRYTDGLSFKYLQAWFIQNHREKADVFVPELTGSGEPLLTFTPAENFKPDPFLKEILSIISGLAHDEKSQ